MIGRDNIIAKVADWRKQQQKKVKMTEVDLCSSGSGS